MQNRHIDSVAGAPDSSHRVRKRKERSNSWFDQDSDVLFRRPTLSAFTTIHDLSRLDMHTTIERPVYVYKQSRRSDDIKDFNILSDPISPLDDHDVPQSAPPVPKSFFNFADTPPCTPSRPKKFFNTLRYDILPFLASILISNFLAGIAHKAKVGLNQVMDDPAPDPQAKKSS